MAVTITTPARQATKKPGRKPGLTPEQRQQRNIAIFRRLCEGLSLDCVAAEFGMHKVMISRIAHFSGVRFSGGDRIRLRVAQLLRTGHTIEEVCAAMCVERKIVRLISRTLAKNVAPAAHP